VNAATPLRTKTQKNMWINVLRVARFMRSLFRIED
jgi:hypothetical protein